MNDQLTLTETPAAPESIVPADAETTIHFYLPKHLAVSAWNMAATEKLSFNSYVLKLLIEDADRLEKADRLQKERACKIVKFPKRRGHEI